MARAVSGFSLGFRLRPGLLGDRDGALLLGDFKDLAPFDLELWISCSRPIRSVSIARSWPIARAFHSAHAP